MTANRGPSIKPSPGTEPKMKHKGHAKLKWHALKGSLETLSQMVFTDILLFIKQFHQNGAFTFIGMLALKAW